MKPVGYAYQLKTLRDIEKRKNIDNTEQALTVLSLRLATIDASSESDERKQADRTRAMRQWEAFMQRPIPANG